MTWVQKNRVVKNAFYSKKLGKRLGNKKKQARTKRWGMKLLNEGKEGHTLSGVRGESHPFYRGRKVQGITTFVPSW